MVHVAKAAILVLVATGCAASGSYVKTTPGVQMQTLEVNALNNVANDSDCRGYRSSQKKWMAFAAGLGVLAGSGGLGTLPVKDDGAKVGIAIGALGVGVLSAVSAVMVKFAADDYVDAGCLKKPGS